MLCVCEKLGKILPVYLKNRVCLEELDIAESIILKWISKK